MNTAGLDVDRIKSNVIQYWAEEPWNWPVKVISASSASSMGALAGRVVSVKGYITSEKFVRGRPLDLAQNILGLLPGELNNGAVLVRLTRLPLPDEFELRGYTQTPGGERYKDGDKWPPGLGAPQWKLLAPIPAAVMKVAGAGERL
ncbi:MAG: hypothetical protein JO323_08165 [Acidobacteriia bacterium]|nr:hypothetical protein [Terriglobia bacterium]